MQSKKQIKTWENDENLTLIEPQVYKLIAFKFLHQFFKCSRTDEENQNMIKKEEFKLLMNNGLWS